MAKIIISRDGQVLQEVELSRERMTIGRHPHNDIVIEHRAVSGQHAVITSILDDAFLEDLDSTNGTTVNGQGIRKHMLQHGDKITIAKFQVEYVGQPPAAVQAAPAATPRPAVTAASAPAAPAAPRAPQRPSVNAPATMLATTAALPTGSVQVMNGPNAGKRLALSKPLTTLGTPGVLVVVISRSVAGYALVHIDGTIDPTVNGVALGKDPRKLVQGDQIDLAGTQMSFSID